ncbi:hypothetical protein B0O99DRAFT_648250 [Bisporella sp. PMI_857]|nr:hypothetical protein B0O99DRAFT_648250 [Bisporella sp. PMI_857]
MSVTLSSPVSPIQTRDIRSSAKAFKRARDNSSKWSQGARPLSGVKNWDALDAAGTWSADVGTTPSPKVRPAKAWSEMNGNHKKPHGNKASKPYPTLNFDNSSANHRVSRKADAIVDAHAHSTAPLSKSLLELLPKHTNNTETAVQTAIRASMSSADDGFLYSFDNRPSPNARGREVDLSGLIDKAEKKWAAKETEKILRTEYAVLDNTGEDVVLKKGKKASPKQPPVPVVTGMDEDDGFELI